MVHLIINPSAQSGNDKADAVKRLETALREKEVLFEKHLSEKAGDAERIAAEICKTGTDISSDSGNRIGQDEKAGRQAPDRDMSPAIVVIGGDGTINEVLNGISDFSRVKMGFLPLGSSNDLARGLGIPDLKKDPEQRVNISRICEEHVCRTIDLGRLHFEKLEAAKELPRDRVFAVSAGVGFDAAVCEEVDRSRLKKFLNRLHQGKLAYGYIGAKQILTARPLKCRVTLDDRFTLSADRLFFAAVHNTPYEGGGYKFAPDARPNDGLLNLAMIGDLSKAKILVHFPAAHEGHYYHVRGVQHAMARKIRIETAAPLWVHTDGEVSVRATDVTMEVIPAALRLIM